MIGSNQLIVATLVSFAALTAVAANGRSSSHLRVLQESTPLQNAVDRLRKLCQRDCLKIGERTEKKCRKACTRRFSELEQLLDVECAAGQDNMGDDPDEDDPAEDDPDEDDPAEDDPAEDDPAVDDPAEDDPAEDDPADDICDIVSDFEGGDEGWKTVGDAEDGRVDPDFISMDGNPGGHIQATDDGFIGVWYFQAPSKFHGDFSDSKGKSLQFDLKQSNTTSQFIARDVIIETDGSLIWFDTDRNPGTEFTSYSIVLDDQAGWKNDDDDEATAKDIKNVLKDVTNILIRGEYRAGPDIGSLDNVVLGVNCE